MNQFYKSGTWTDRARIKIWHQIGRSGVHLVQTALSASLLWKFSKVLVAILLISCHAAFAQSRQVSGTVFDNSGTPLPGASVQLKSTTTGTITDSNGKYTVQAKDDATLVFSYIGYIKQEALVGTKTTIDVTLKLEESSLSEVVVVGYGTRTKANLSGSVTTVTGKELTERPVPNVQNLLQGRVSGLDVIQSTGEPGRDDAAYQLRGFGSFGASNAPLILVDGIIGTIKNLSPQDIESVTVLKDAASASIYGARAANGVILITTKKGKAGSSEIEYTGSYGISQATRNPDLITNSVQYMEMYNSARARSGQTPLYTQAQIDLYKSNPNSDQYPNFNWLDYVLDKGPIQNHHLGFSGGNEKTLYNISFNYLDQESITKGYLYNRYNGLVDFSSQVHKKVRVGTNLNLSYQNAKAPWLVNDDLLLLAYASAPTFRPFLPDGSGRVTNRDFVGNGAGNRSVEEVYATGGQFTKTYNVNAQAFVEIEILKGLKWLNKAGVTFYNDQLKNRQFGSPSFAYQPDASGKYVQVANGNPTFFGLLQREERSITKTFFSTLNYNKQFGTNHTLGLLAGFEQQENLTERLSGNRFDFPNTTIMVLDGSGANNQSTAGSASEWALRSMFGRVNYDYKGKYFLEGNIRRDGTSRVSSRWGTFGGGSAAWRISEEGFIKNSLSWVDNLKLRASYGVLGNQEINVGVADRLNLSGNYPYQDILSLTAYPYTTLSSGAQLTRLVTPDLRWEKTAMLDFGLDIDIFRGLFGATIDWYKRNTTDILSTRADLPSSVGLSAPIVNAGGMQNKGIEVELRHRKSFGDFNYGVSVLFHKYNNKVTKLLAPTLGTIEIGQPYNNFFVYDWIGVFQSQEEINSSPKQPSSGTLKPGDLKIRDVDGNGTVGPEDRIRISRFPKYNYSFSLNAGWKGFNLTAFFQGVQGINTQVNGWGYEPFQQGSAPPKRFLDAWSPTNPSNTIPATYLTGYAGVSGYTSTYFIQDASYLRLKNLYLSYAFNEKILSKIKSKGLTVYVSGDNLITWTKYEGNDPERAGSGRFAQFPQLKIFTAGLSVKF
ncbi:TonB-dependent receptor [Dyadobacter sp. LHD-138]|uniref:SusC/RagA family TonB-linked outer membrane protein n=1 Tax=Dyadobacter sp. LHD-138 TaxID=3071413 RepID=UPI0027E0D2BB|nr:TonB-dependent receptor [Dyadobacter sp. LHD-138]MDQ6481087.1 TonB-dependent receptor [Dyadobacter sp. LHD-138]